jgi:hypothetical protein
METIQNKVAESGIQVVNLEHFLPKKPVSGVDLASFLDGGFLLREKPFRSHLKAQDWSSFENHHVGIHCSTDAIIPPWVFMLTASYLSDVAATVSLGTVAQVRESLTILNIEQHSWEPFADRIVVLKGCGSDHVTPAAYIKATVALQQVARKLMYGEPCSSVPVWRASNS